MLGTRVTFAAGDVTVEVTIEQDTPTTRSFLAMLPMTLEFSDFGGKEKVAMPTGEWDFTGAAGLNPKVGDLFSYMPWGNLGFFYNTDGNTFDEALTKIGETGDIDQIRLLDGQQVIIDVAD
ncbi:cyclophilin-like fold protein [Microbacterium sp. KSW4-11]|uniref:Cyclophilin-like fold protein n=1 Tax=Microbacterium gawkjiense TaxID=3067309 RepID=A0ABU3G768_9MICO|nr:cyclophilin-like fold protein [Microbacterium sp. KSW4-11]MDT3315672.1 cyclophilin-like fold protein [Microbacterium sp. KSW4-11]